MSDIVKSAHIDEIPPLHEAAGNEPEWKPAVGRSEGTTILALGAARGEAFTPSEWELEYVR